MTTTTTDPAADFSAAELLDGYRIVSELDRIVRRLRLRLPLPHPPGEIVPARCSCPNLGRFWRLVYRDRPRHVFHVACGKLHHIERHPRPIHAPGRPPCA